MRHIASLIALSAALATVARAQGFPQPSGFTWEDPVLRRIWAVGMDSSHVQPLAQTLLDSLGPRLTASPGMESAQNWLMQTYGAWGSSARKERYGTWRSWRRGPTHVDLVAPRVRSLEAMMEQLTQVAIQVGDRPDQRRLQTEERYLAHTVEHTVPGRGCQT